MKMVITVKEPYNTAMLPAKMSEIDLKTALNCQLPVLRHFDTLFIKDGVLLVQVPTDRNRKNQLTEQRA